MRHIKIYEFLLYYFLKQAYNKFVNDINKYNL